MIKTEDDKRRLRSAQSREKIGQAVVAFAKKRNFNPSNQEIADASGVSLRTVFRYVDSLDEFVNEIANEINAQLLPILFKPYLTTDWKKHLCEAASRRAQIHEHILFVKMAADLRRFRSPPIMEAYRDSLTLHRAHLIGILPEDVQSDQDLVECLNLSMSFESYRSLRIDQNHSPKTAERIVIRSISALLSAA